MREKIFNEILKVYPAFCDARNKWQLADAILNLPVDGLKVTRKYNQINENAFEVGLEYERHFTIGEALEMLPKMVYLLSEKVNDPLYRDALTTKDGGIVGVKE